MHESLNDLIFNFKRYVSTVSFLHQFFVHFNFVSAVSILQLTFALLDLLEYVTGVFHLTQLYHVNLQNYYAVDKKKQSSTLVPGLLSVLRERNPNPIHTIKLLDICCLKYFKAIVMEGREKEQS